MLPDSLDCLITRMLVAVEDGVLYEGEPANGITEFGSLISNPEQQQDP